MDYERLGMNSEEFYGALTNYDYEEFQYIPHRKVSFDYDRDINIYDILYLEEVYEI